MFESSGAGITIHSPDQTLTIGLGSSPTGLHFGFSDSFKFHGYDLTAGDHIFSFSQLVIVERGLAVEKHFERNCTAKPTGARLAGFTGCSHEKRLIAFVGSTGSSFNPVFFQSYRLNSAGAGIYAEEIFKNGSLSTLESVHGHRYTALESAEWTPSVFRFSIGGGVLENVPRFDAQAQMRPKSWMQFAVGHNEIQANNGRQTEFFKYDSAQAAFLTRHFTIYGSAFEGQQRLSVFSGASIRLAGFDNQIGYFHTTREPRIITDNISKRVGIYEVSGFYSNTQGHQTFGIGGGIHTNRFTLSLNHQVLYNIALGVFQNTSTLNLSFRVHDATVSLGGLRDPTRKIRYNVFGNDYIQAGFANAPQQNIGLGGKYVAKGFVVDEHNKPIQGAAILLDKQELFSDAVGYFEAHIKHKSARVSVNVLEFAAPGEWELVSAPSTITAGEPARIVVRRVR